jgi:hypothetical protein
MSRRALVLDTAVVMVLAVGAADPALLGSTQHLRGYAPEDYPLVLALARRFKVVAVTPHVLTEVAHFLSKIPRPMGDMVKVKFVEIIGALRERAPLTRQAVQRVEFRWLDLADCGLLEVAGENDVLFTGDARLAARRYALGGLVINFHQLRERAWELQGWAT